MHVLGVVRETSNNRETEASERERERERARERERERESLCVHVFFVDSFQEVKDMFDVAACVSAWIRMKLDQNDPSFKMRQVPLILQLLCQFRLRPCIAEASRPV